MGIIVTLTVFYGNVANLWWMFDDTQHLKLVALTELKVFTKPAAEVGYIPANFTPWLFLNYWIDLKLFGLDPRGAHIHQLLSLGFTVAAAFYLLKRIMMPVIASGTLVVFFLTPVAHTVIHILCTRHYLEGLGYACLGLAFYLKYRNSNRYAHLILAVIFSFIAFLNKEVYLPLVGIVTCISFFDFVETKSRRKLIPIGFFTSAAFVYFCYRAYALGWQNLITGYGSAIDHRGPIEITIYLKEIIIFNQLGILIALLLISFLVYASRKLKEGIEIYSQFKFLTLNALALVCILAPIYKVMPTANINHNYIFLATFSLVVATGYFVSKLLDNPPFFKPKAQFISVFSVFLAMIFLQIFITLPNATLNIQNNTSNLYDKHKVEGVYLLYSKDPVSHTLADAAGAPWHQSGLIDLRAQYLRLPPGPSVCTEVCRCANNGTVYRYNNGKLVEINRSELKCNQE